jgi:hypothetical protein
MLAVCQGRVHQTQAYNQTESRITRCDPALAFFAAADLPSGYFFDKSYQ